MATTNSITGDALISRVNNKNFNNRYEWAFCKDNSHKPDKENELGVYVCPSCGMKSEILIINGLPVLSIGIL